MGVSAGKDSLAGKLLQGKKSGLCLCRSQPAGEWWRSTGMTAGKDSLAGQRPQGEETAFDGPKNAQREGRRAPMLSSHSTNHIHHLRFIVLVQVGMGATLLSLPGRGRWATRWSRKRR